MRTCIKTPLDNVSVPMLKYQFSTWLSLNKQMWKISNMNNFWYHDVITTALRERSHIT